MIIKFDAETLKIAKQIKALKEGNKQGEIKITLKGDGAPSITRSKTEKKNEQGQKLKNCMTEVQKEIKEQEGENEKGSEADSDGEEVHVEEEKQGSKNKSTSNKNPSIKIFNHFDGIKDLKEFLIK